jgi:soluble lytic murein transglycosylase
VRAFANARDTRRALQLATAATKTGSAGKRAEAWFRVAELQRDLGNSAAQHDALLDAIETAPESQAAADAAFVLVERKGITTEDRVLAARTLIRSGHVSRGVKEAERALATGRVKSTSQLHYDVGRVLFGAGRYNDAIKHLKLVARGHGKRTDARFLMARAQYRSGKTTAGKQTLRDVADAYPKSAAATRALYLLGDFAQDENKTADARRLFEKAASAPTKTEESSLALMRLGAISYAQGDYTRAATIFERLRSRFSSGEYRDQATYWLAQTRLRRGNETGGNELLRQIVRSSPVSYYGMRAAEALGGSLEPIAADPPENSTATAATINEALDRWSLLREVGWNEAASFELGRLRQRLKDDRPALYAYAEELQRRGAPHVAIEAGRTLLRDGAQWNERLLRILYPLPYLEVIEREARLRKLDPYFVAAVIRQESRFNSNARSGAGAIGLMQVMPGTQRVLVKAGLDDADGSLKDAETNIKLGTKFLADLVRMYDQRTDLVLAAYNAGPSRADRWRRFPEVAAQDLFIERIPFEETRDYVKVVQLNAAIYRALYGSHGAASR